MCALVNVVFRRTPQCFCSAETEQLYLSLVGFPEQLLSPCVSITDPVSLSDTGPFNYENIPIGSLSIGPI